MRIAMLTYSVRPRGGVVHAHEVSEALARRGHRVELIALARHDEALYRSPAVPLHVVRLVPSDAPFDERVQVMLATYADGLRPLLAAGGYDVVHAQDCLSANAALELRDDGVIPHVIRTVHHVDDFTSPSMVECQERSITEPIYRVGKDLGHVHLSETNGSLLGTGHLDILSVFRALADIGYDRYVSVKVYRGTPWEQAAVSVIQHLRSMGLVS